MNQDYKTGLNYRNEMCIWLFSLIFFQAIEQWGHIFKLFLYMPVLEVLDEIWDSHAVKTSGTRILRKTNDCKT